MLQRGRKAASAASILQLPGKHAEPPADLTETQQRLWRDITATKPISWFSADALPILRQYVAHCESALQINWLINVHDGKDFNSLEKLLGLRDRESKILIRLATALRLTPHSRTKAETAATQHANVGGGEKPWED